jgi:hypothetical protein
VGEIFDNYIPDKELITRIYWVLKKLTPQDINNLLNKWANEMNGQFSNDKIQ